MLEKRTTSTFQSLKEQSRVVLTQDARPRWVDCGSNPHLDNERPRVQESVPPAAMPVQWHWERSLANAHSLLQLLPQVIPITSNISLAEASSWPSHPN